MSRLPLKLSVGAFLAAAICVPAPSAEAQIPARVRVINRPAPIKRWLHAPATEVLREVGPGTTLDVLDKEMDWFWVVVPPDTHGTRKAGWIRASNVEPVGDVTPAPEQPAELTSAAPADTSSATSVGADDKVTITSVGDESGSGDAAANTYTFDDLHFDRNRDALRAEDMGTLRAAAAALKANPSLVVSISGYTCNLGTTTHNRALGGRRANAVKDYLVSEGIAADRLHAVGVGEGDARHDNSREESRRLNRRVSITPDGQRESREQ